MNMFETIKKNASTNPISPEEFFSTTGLKIAKDICTKNKRLNCCKEVSEAVVNEANKLGIECSVINPIVFIKGKDDPYMNHYVILQGNKIIDFTYKQFLGSNSSNDVDLLICGSIMDSVYADKSINTSDDNKIEFIKKFKDGKIKEVDLIYITDLSLDEMIKLNDEEPEQDETLNESVDVKSLEKYIKGNTLTDAAIFLGMYLNGDANSVEIQGSTLVDKLNNKNIVTCTMDASKIASVIKEDE